MISDSAAEFTSEAIKTLCAAHGIRKLEVATYHPNSNGLAERFNSKILKILKTIAENMIQTIGTFFVMTA